MSGRHAVLSRSGADVVLEDLGSADGTLVTWRYLFYLKPGLGIGPKRLVFKAVVVDLIWNRMMTKTLVNLTQIITLRALQAGKK